MASFMGAVNMQISGLMGLLLFVYIMRTTMEPWACSETTCDAYTG
jgi:hypothetical protein